jgi:uncharacterized protein YjbI with pentapeptide repeats
MSVGDLLAIEVIAVVGVLLLISTIIPGVRLYWPRHRDPVSRSDLGVALMGGALIAFAILVLQVMIQFRAEADDRDRAEQASRDARERQEQADRQALLLLLGRSQNLSGVDLHEENLSAAYLSAKQLRGANLGEANMVNASLEDAKLVDANLAGARLDAARLDRADLRHADLSGASLVGATLTAARLDAARLSPRREGTRRARVDLSGADLSNAWVRADLRGADLSHATLVGTHFAPANLQGADFNGADLEFADLRGANLRGANLEGAVNLDKAKDLSYARHDASTSWPFGFTWNDSKPTCSTGSCTLGKSPFPVTDFPHQLEAMRTKLVRATNRSSCLAGWRVEDTPLKIVARAPRNRARINIQTWTVDSGSSADDWARSFWRFKAKVRPITKSPADLVLSEYAERYVSLQEEERGLEVVAVYLVRGSVGFKLSGLAPPTLVDIYQRDFLKAFRALGVRANVFPSLRGGEDECSSS